MNTQKKTPTQTSIVNPYATTGNNAAALCSLSDLPPHPAGGDLYKTYPAPYQLDPHGYVEQNLFASHSPTHHNSSQGHENSTKTKTEEISVVPRQPSSEPVPSDANLNDIMFSNPGARDFTQDKRFGMDTDGTESGYDTIDLKDSRDGEEGKRDSFIIENAAVYQL